MNNTVTINPTSAPTPGGINKMDLLQSKDPEILEMYEQVFANADDSFTTVVDNDSAQKIKVAVTALQPNELQVEHLLKIKEAFRLVEKKMDPARLRFTIDRAMDDEICLSRTSNDGLAKIIINDDGLVVLTFVAYRGINKPDKFLPYTEGVSDYEGLAYEFFAL